MLIKAGINISGIAVKVVDRCLPGFQRERYANVRGYMAGKRNTHVLCSSNKLNIFIAGETRMQFQEIVAGEMLFAGHFCGLLR